jgi:hypothetical protein
MNFYVISKCFLIFLVVCPLNNGKAVDFFSKLTSTAREAHHVEIDTRTTVDEIELYGKDILNLLDSDSELPKDYIRKYIAAVSVAMAKTQHLKSKYMLYGTTCLEFLGLGSRLTLSKLQRLAGTQRTTVNDTLRPSEIRSRLPKKTSEVGMICISTVIVL